MLDWVRAKDLTCVKKKKKIRTRYLTEQNVIIVFLKLSKGSAKEITTF